MTPKDRIKQIQSAPAEPSFLGWLFAIEAKQTANEIGKILGDATPEEKALDIQTFFIKRWERIRSTDLAYVHAINHSVTLLCLDLAKRIAPIIGKSTLALLMPTIQTPVSQITLLSLEEYKLQHILLGNDDTTFIDILASLEYAQHIALSSAEQSRVVNHSTETQAYHDASLEIIKMKQNGSIGAAIENCLINRLYHAGKDGKRDGNAETAGLDAAIGRIHFQHFLNTLTRSEKRKLFSCKVSPDSDLYFGHLWDRLVNPKQTIKPQNNNHAVEENLDSIYCVEIVAIDLSILLKHNQHLFNKKTAKRTQFIEILNANRASAAQHLITKLSRADFNVASTYGLEGETRLITQVLTTEILDTLTREESETASKHVKALDTMHFFQRFEAIPRAHRFNFIKFIGINHIQDKICQDGYQLAKLFSLLPEPDQEKLLALLTQNHLQFCLRDKFQFAEALLALSPARCEQLLLLLGANHLQSVFKCSHNLKVILTKKLPIDQWDKIALVLQSGYLSRVLGPILTNEFDQLPAGSHWKFVTLVGIQRALSFMQDAGQLRKFLAFFTAEQQSEIFTHLDFRKIFLSDQKEKLTLKSTIASTLNKLDPFKAFPKIHQKMAMETLSFYCEERAKKSHCLGFFSSKTKAAQALHLVAAKAADPSTLKEHKKQLERDNDLGHLYQHIKMH
ncbi:MAG: hypothetical protein P4M14_08890 [Gammaproteobacteria bacterium]|nr:hypothetical protein [Gammaproteobacteria bacterium]